MSQAQHQSYPLAWPNGWPRSKERSRAQFKTARRPLELAEGVNRVFDELERFGINMNHIIVSTNIRPTLGGRGHTSAVTDTGAAVYWRDGQHDRVMAVDRYDRVADNLAAIAATLEFMRGIERHGGAQILNRAFAGFTALPGPAPREWQVVLGLEVGREYTMAEVDTAYKRARSAAHTDKGGQPGEFDEVQRAYEQAISEGEVRE